MSKDTIGKCEKRGFKLDPAILFTVIYAQAGTLDKAILELVMNSIDAGASFVNIKLTGKKVSVQDDGKGFVSRQEIDSFFETFGTPHEAGDARYGRFRIERGQIMAFTKNVWRSGQFKMDVDVKNRGDEYDLFTLDESIKGCLIEGVMYDALKPSEVINVTDKLREMCKYAPIPVVVNDETVSIDVSKVKWSFEDDDAYYLLRESSRYLEVFNLGVHVKNYFQSEFGLGGVVVSKKQLELNSARNDILVAKCAVWKRIAPKLRAHAKRDQEKKPVQNEGYRDIMMKKLLAANFDSTDEFFEALSSSKVFTDISGKHYSFDQLRTALYQFGERIVAEEKQSLKADKVQQQKLALVLAPITLERANWMSFKDIVNRIIKNLKHQVGDRRVEWKVQEAVRIKDALVKMADVAGAINDNHALVDEKDLSKEEKLVLKTLREQDWVFAYAAKDIVSPNEDSNCYSARYNARDNVRTIKICESDTVLGYTDGKTMVALERKLLKIGGSAGNAFSAFERIKAVMMHEYLHDSDDSTGHGHPGEFYERFHQAMDYSELHGFTYGMMKSYMSFRRKAGTQNA